MNYVRFIYWTGLMVMQKHDANSVERSSIRTTWQIGPYKNKHETRRTTRRNWLSKLTNWCFWDNNYSTLWNIYRNIAGPQSPRSLRKQVAYMDINKGCWSCILLDILVERTIEPWGDWLCLPLCCCVLPVCSFNSHEDSRVSSCFCCFYSYFYYYKLFKYN